MIESTAVETIRVKYQRLQPLLNERLRRQWAACVRLCPWVGAVVCNFSITPDQRLLRAARTGKSKEGSVCRRRQIFQASTASATSGASRPLADQRGQAGDLAQAPDPVLQIVPETHPQLATGLLQTGKRVPATTARFAPRTPADLPPLHELPDVRLHPIVVHGTSGRSNTRSRSARCSRISFSTPSMLG